MKDKRWKKCWLEVVYFAFYSYVFETHEVLLTVVSLVLYQQTFYARMCVLKEVSHFQAILLYFPLQ